MLQDATVTVGSTFSLETCCDHLMIRGNDVEESKDIPTFLSAYETFSWSSDEGVTSEGWQLCFSDEHCFVMEKLCDNCDISGSEVSKGSGYTLSSCQNECLQDPSCLGIDFGKNGRLGECFFNTGQATSHGSNSDFDGWRKANTCASTTTPPGSGSDYFTFSGDCDVQGDCVSSNNYPSVHGNGESCYVTMLQDASVTPGGTFNLETCCDHLMIRGSDIESSYAVPFFLTAGETFIWTSDGSVSREGWQLCFSGDCDARGKTTSKYFSMSGDCDARGDCVSSSNYPNVHGHGDICTVTMLQDAAVIPGSTFEIETCCDHLMIRGVDTENPSDIPSTLAKGERFSWTSDNDVSRKGWQICFSEGSDQSSSRSSSGSIYFTMTGDCDVQGDCVSSSNYPNVHGHGEICTVTMLQHANVTPGSTFSLETCCDHLMIRGVDTEKSSDIPFFLAAGEKFSWTSDKSVSREGWQLCFSDYSN